MTMNYFELATALVRAQEIEMGWNDHLDMPRWMARHNQEETMPKFATESKYLKYTDLEELSKDGGDVIVTISTVKQETLENQGVKQKKWCIYFTELEKGLALNATNGKTICKVLGTDEMNDWKGQKIILHVKEDVEFGGELVSAIRVRPRKP